MIMQKKIDSNAKRLEESSEDIDINQQYVKLQRELFEAITQCKDHAEDIYKKDAC